MRSTKDSKIILNELSGTDSPKPTRCEISVCAVDFPSWLVRQPGDHDEFAVLEMAASIAKVGLINDVVVQEAQTSGRYWLIAGVGRLLAARQASLASISARVYSADLPESAAIRIMFEENETRVPIPPLLKARWFRDRMKEKGVSQNRLAAELGIRQRMVSDHIRVLNGPSDLIRRVESGELSFSRALQLLRRSVSGRPGRGVRAPVIRGTKAKAPAGGEETPPWGEKATVVGGHSEPISGTELMVAVVALPGAIGAAIPPAAAAAACERLAQLFDKFARER